MHAPDRCLGTWLAGLALAGLLAAQDETAKEPAKPTGEQALATAMAKAKKHHRQVLVAVTAKDEALGAALRKALKGPALSRLLLYEFEQAQLDCKDDAAALLRLKIDADKLGVPAVVALDADGKTLATFGKQALFGDGETLLQKPLAEALQKLVCTPQDAEQLLAAALAEAKKADKRLLLTFDAPW